jgi:hypothetical protein
MTLYYSLVSTPPSMSILGAVTIENMAIGFTLCRLLACPPTLPQPKDNVASILTIIFFAGLSPLGDGDAHLPRPYRPAAVHLAPQALHLHL